jgi:hypothetical protein
VSHVTGKDKEDINFKVPMQCPSIVLVEVPLRKDKALGSGNYERLGCVLLS